MKLENKHRVIPSGPLILFAAIAGISLLLVGITAWIDFGNKDISLLELFYETITGGAAEGLPEVIVAVIAVSITVVAIIVELASNRYTARITELFMASAVNIIILSFFVVTGILCLWLCIIGSSSEMVPKTGAILTILFVIICMLLLLPYFAFVFHFLNPHNIIDRMVSSVLSAIARGGSENSVGPKMKKCTVTGIEQLADVASGAIESKDKVVCMHAVNALGDMVVSYIERKKNLNKEWFIFDETTKENPDFVSMQSHVLTQIETGKYWLEMKVLRQYQMLYGESLNKMRDINHLLAINTKKMAVKALEADDIETLNVCIKFFNTYMRATINAKDVRTAYNVFNQYRLLAQEAMKRQKYTVTLDIASRFKYYGQVSFSMGLAFILETAAYDLCDLNELAYCLDVPIKKELLAIFLDVDKEAEEGHSLEASLRGVRKAQIKLATFYIKEGQKDLAWLIFEDVKTEIPSRLASIHEELRRIKDRDFWEINDRGVNFDYLDDARREALETFFGWFKSNSKEC